MANAENVVNVSLDKQFTAGILRGMANEIHDDFTPADLRDLLNEFADSLVGPKEGDNND